MVSPIQEIQNSEFAQWLQLPRADLTSTIILEKYKKLFRLFDTAHTQHEYIEKLKIIYVLMLFTRRVPKRWFYIHPKILHAFILKVDYFINKITHSSPVIITSYEELWMNRCIIILHIAKYRLEQIILQP